MRIVNHQPIWVARIGYIRFFFWILPLLFIFSGCTSLGPRRVPPDRFDYNQALADSIKEQMLINIVRIRYFEEPVFLSVGSILTQYLYNAGIGVGGSFDLGGGSDSITPNANLNYEERPTITYLPIEGQEFAGHLLSAIPVEQFFAAAHEGWLIDILLQIGIHRIGAVENMSFEAIPPPGEIDLQKQIQRDLEKARRFQRVLKLLFYLNDIEAFEVQLIESNDTKENHLIFAEDNPQDVQLMVDELKNLLGLSNRNRFRITKRLTGIKDDEISVQTRSVFAMMAFLSKGVEVPFEHIDEGRVIDYQFQKSGVNNRSGLIPFKMHSSKKMPDNPFAAVRYQGYWFYIDIADITSKRALSLMNSLFRLMAPSQSGTAPILSLPTG